MKPEPELGVLLSGLLWFSSKNFLNKSLNSSGMPGGVWNWFCPLELDTVLVAFTITTAGMFSSTMFVKSGYDAASASFIKNIQQRHKLTRIFLLITRIFLINRIIIVITWIFFYNFLYYVVPNWLWYSRFARG